MAKMVEVICVPQTEQESTFVLNNAIKVISVPRFIADFADVKQIPMEKCGNSKSNFEIPHIADIKQKFSRYCELCINQGISSLMAARANQVKNKIFFTF